MFETVKDALKSNDIKLIKRILSTFKSNLTRAANSLKRELKMSEDGDFQFDEIDKNEVEAIFSNFKKVKDTMDELHLKFTVIRVQKDGHDEDRLQEEDDTYADLIEKIHRESSKLYNSFNSQFEAKEKLIKNEEFSSNKRSEYVDKLQRFKSKVSE